MKKILFLAVFLSSFAFGADDNATEALLSTTHTKEECEQICKEKCDKDEYISMECVTPCVDSCMAEK